MSSIIDNFIQNITQYAEKHNILIICTRPYDDFQSASDIDLFTPKKTAHIIINYIRSLGIGICHYTESESATSFYIHYIHKNEILYTKIDFIHEFDLWNIAYFPIHSVIENSTQNDSEIHCMDRVQQSIYLVILYHVKHKTKLPQKYLSFIDSVIHEHRDDVHLFFIKNFGDKKGTEIFYNIRINQPQSNKSSYFYYIIQAWSYRGLDTAIFIAKYFMQKFLYKVNPKTQFVAFIGVDGSGKTTIINQFKSIYPCDNNLYAHFLPAWPFIEKEYDSSLTQSNPHNKPARSIITSCFKLYAYVLRYWCVYLWPRKKPVTYFLDRYLYDIMIDPARFRYDGPEWLIRTVCSHLPKPEILIHMDIDPHTASKRKNELPVHELERQIKCYREKISGFSNAYTIQGTHDPIDNCHKIMALICHQTP